MKKLILALLLFPLSVLAQTATFNITIGWTAPTQNTDGSSITAGSLTYNLYQGPKAGPFTQVATGIATTTSTVTSAAAGNCFVVETLESQGSAGGSTASALAGTACAEVPNPASNVTITFTVTVK